MPYITYTNGLTIKSPTRGTTNYEETLRNDTWTKISSHDHSAGGKGVQLGTAAILADAITDLKIRLRTNQYLRSRNNAGSGDVNLLKSNVDDVLEFGVGLSSKQSVVLANNISSPTTTLLPAVTKKGARIVYNVYIDATGDLSQTGILEITYNGTDYELGHEYTGNAGIQFSIVAGVIKYISADITGFASSIMTYLTLTLGA